MPSLEAECHAFAKSTKETQADRRKAALVLEHHDKLQDLLEVPQLLDTCVRNGYYHEALELGNHAREMAAQYGEVPIVRDVEREVEKGLLGMLVQLLSLLREPIKLPALVKTVGFLRRMDALSEEELQVAFLASREHNFRSQLVGIERERGEPVRYVRRYVDLFRENVYDVISQFTTIFLDHAATLSTSSSSSSSLSDFSASALSPSSSLTSPAYRSAPNLLLSFADQSLHSLITTLDTYVPLIEDPSALSSLLTQLNYCATSFARVGLDFRSLVVEPFSLAVLLSTEKAFKEAEAGLEASLRSALRNGKPPSAWLVPQESLGFVLDLDLSAPFFPSSLFTSSSSTYGPPRQLSHFPDLSLLCNAHTNTLNSLRLLAPIALFPQLVQLQRDSLARSASTITSYFRSASSEFGTALGATHGGAGAGTGVGGRPGHRRNPSISAQPSERERKETSLILRAFGRAFESVLVPFLRKGLVEGVYGSELGSLEVVDKRSSVSMSTAAAVGAALSGQEKEVEGLSKLRDWLEGIESELRPSPPPTVEVKTAPPLSRSSSALVPAAVSEEPEEMDADTVPPPKAATEKEGATNGSGGEKDIDAEIKALEGDGAAAGVGDAGELAVG